MTTAYPRLMALFGFPDPVNETSARLVAAGVVLQCVVYLVFREWWLLVPLAFGFVARVASGPRFSPLGRLVTGVITPAIARRSDRSPRLVPGPPKRFAQGIGVVFSVGRAGGRGARRRHGGDRVDRRA